MSNALTLTEALDLADARDDQSRAAAETVRDALIRYDGKTITGNRKRIESAIAKAVADLSGPALVAELDCVASSHWCIVIRRADQKPGDFLNYIVVCYGGVYDAAKFKELNPSQYAGVDARRASRSALVGSRALERAAELVERRNKARAALEAADRDIAKHLVDVEVAFSFPIKDQLAHALEATK